MVFINFSSKYNDGEFEKADLVVLDNNETFDEKEIFEKSASLAVKEVDNRWVCHIMKLKQTVDYDKEIEDYFIKLPTEWVEFIDGKPDYIDEINVDKMELYCSNKDDCIKAAKKLILLNVL